MWSPHPMVNKTGFDILIIETNTLLGKRWEVAGSSTFYLFHKNFADKIEQLKSVFFCKRKIIHENIWANTSHLLLYPGLSLWKLLATPYIIPTFSAYFLFLDVKKWIRKARMVLSAMKAFLSFYHNILFSKAHGLIRFLMRPSNQCWDRRACCLHGKF